MPKYLKDIKRSQSEIPKRPFRIREDFVAPWQASIHTSVEEQDIKRDISQDSDSGNIEIQTRYIRDRNTIASRHIQDSKPDNNPVATRQLTREHQAIKQDIHQDIERDIKLLRHHVKGLIGHQKNLFEYVLDFANLNDGFNSGFISSHEMALSIGCTYAVVKITLFNMIKKGLLIRHKGKGCRGGYIILEIPKEIKGLYCEFHQDIKRDIKRDISQDKTENHYSSSNKNITIGKGWDEIDCNPLEEIHFDKGCLKQLKECGAHPEIVQASINHFAFERNKVTDTKERNEKYHLKLIMGVLRKGNAWTKPQGYLSPQEKILQDFRDEKKAEEGRVRQMMDQLFEEQFNEWYSKISLDIRNKRTVGDLRLEFRKTDWSEIYKRIKK